MRPLAALIPAFRSWLTGFLGLPQAPFGERVVRFLTAAIVVVGFLLRARGYLWHPSAFWLDECSWAMNLVEQPLVELCIRPIGFMWVSRLLAQTLSLTEPVLRFMPWLAGMTTVALAPALARRLFVNPGARLLFVFILALHPAAIDFSKEFKPYSCSLMLHLLLLLLTLRYVDTRLPRDLAWLLVAATLGGLFAQDLVFAYPGVFLVTGYTALRTRPRQAIAVVAVAGLIILLLLAQYHFSWSKNPPSDTRVWGNKYNVFYTGRGSYRAWWLSRHEGMATFPAFRQKFWHVEWLSSRRLDLARNLDTTLWLCLHVLGLSVIALFRRQRALLLVLPIVLVWTFNFLALWPIGAFRANLFVVGYMSAIACMAFDVPARVLGKLGDVFPAFVLVLLPFLVLDPFWSDHKQALTYESDFPKVLRTLISAKLTLDGPDREALVLDRRSCDPYRYYTEFHPVVSRRLKHVLGASFNAICVTEEARYRHALLAAMPRAPHHVWTILHSARPVWNMIRRHALDDAEEVFDEHVVAHTVMAFSHPAITAEPRPADAEGGAEQPVHGATPAPTGEEEGSDEGAGPPANGRF
jgi:Dolichyl-phosphate-mannose-protein mannosyltransferase